MKKLIQKYSDFIHSPGDGLNLGIIRFLFYFTTFCLIKELNFAKFYASHNLVENLWLPPSSVKYLYYPGPFSYELTHTLEGLFRVSLLFSSAGLFSKFFLPITALLAYYLFGLEFGYIQTHYKWNVLTLSMFVLAFSKAGDHFSLDALIRKKFHKPAAPRYSHHYGWPVKLILFLLIWMYFSSAISKFRNSGIGWVTKNQLLYYAQLTHQWNQRIALFEIQKELNYWLSTSPKASYLLSTATLLLEGLSPIALYTVSSRKIIIPLLITMHLCFFLFFYIYNFKYLIPIYLFWVDWCKMLLFLKGCVSFTSIKHSLPAFLKYR